MALIGPGKLFCMSVLDLIGDGSGLQLPEQAPAEGHWHIKCSGFD